MQNEECSHILQMRNLVKFCKIITLQNLKPHIRGTDSGLGFCGVLQSLPFDPNSANVEYGQILQNYHSTEHKASYKRN